MHLRQIWIRRKNSLIILCYNHGTISKSNPLFLNVLLLFINKLDVATKINIKDLEKMRPLGHLGVGLGTPDYDLCEINDGVYDALSERGEALIEAAKAEFMGHYYNNPPLKTLNELQKECDKLLSDKTHFERLKAPAILIENAEEQIIELYQQIQNKNYGKLSDPVYKKYREVYEQKERDWLDSEILKTLEDKIYEYNESEYNNIKLQQGFATK